MTSFEQLSSAQKNRASLYRDVQAISTETCHFLGLEITKPAMEIVAELVYKKLSVYGIDLEAFAKNCYSPYITKIHYKINTVLCRRHAKRSTINTEDVKLLVRRCPSLKTHLNTLAPTAAISKEKKRKTIIAVRQTETPIPKAKESEIRVSKQGETEIKISKQKDSGIPAPTLKQEVEKEADRISKVESMIMDDLIDLTFD